MCDVQSNDNRKAPDTAPCAGSRPLASFFVQGLGPLGHSFLFGCVAFDSACRDRCPTHGSCSVVVAMRS